MEVLFFFFSFACRVRVTVCARRCVARCCVRARGLARIGGRLLEATLYAQKSMALSPPPRRYSRYAFHFALLFVFAPLGAYVAFKPSGKDNEPAAWAKPAPGAAQKREAIVNLIMRQDADKEQKLGELMKKGTPSSSSS